MLRSPGDPATPDRGDQATSARHADRAAARATAIAADPAAAMYVERGTIANGLAAWHPGPFPYSRTCSGRRPCGENGVRYPLALRTGQVRGRDAAGSWPGWGR